MDLNRTVKLIKLNRRYSHSGLFSHMYQFRNWETKQEFHDAIMYCHQQWGPSVDVETYVSLLQDSKIHKQFFEFSPQWSYLARYGDQRIYLTDEAVTWISIVQPWKP